MAQFPNSDQADGIWTLKKVRRAILGENWPVALEPDQFFANTVLLLNADNASDGGQNNTFLDSSSNAHTITRNGNVTQGSFSPFSVDEGKWGNYFDGSGDYIAVDQGAVALENWYSEDYSIEMWVNPSAHSESGTNSSGLYIGHGIYNTTTIYWSLGTSNTGYLRWYYFNGSGQSLTATTEQLPLNTWSHVALVYTHSTGAIKGYVNGVEVISGTKAGTPQSNNANDINIGVSQNTFYTGYISNLRIVKGSAVYTAAFTPPTAPLTDITNTSLLTCQSNRFLDNSTNAHTLTPAGDVKVVPFSPFPQTAPYNASTNGGSGYFDGSGDYLRVSSDPSLALGTDDFTLECWFYMPSSFSPSLNDSLFANDTTPGFQISWSSTGFVFMPNGSSRLLNTSGVTTDIFDAWHHIAYARQGSALYGFLDGILIGTSTSSAVTTNFTNDIIDIGVNRGGTGYINAYISDVRVVKGTAVYTSAFTPPTAPLTDVSGTSLLTNFTNASIVDATGKNVLETVGNAQVDTTTVKYGTGAMEFDGNGDYLLTPSSENFAFGTGDYTVECWVYPQALNLQRAFVDIDNGTWQLYNNTSGRIIFFNGSNRITSSVITNNSWYHIAITRSGTDTKLFINGVQEGSTYTDSTNYSGPYALAVADRVDGGLSEFNGYIDDFRITKGIARYTANFTPPTKELPIVGE